MRTSGTTSKSRFRLDAEAAHKSLASVTGRLSLAIEAGRLRPSILAELISSTETALAGLQGLQDQLAALRSTSTKEE